MEAVRVTSVGTERFQNAGLPSSEILLGSTKSDKRGILSLLYFKQKLFSGSKYFCYNKNMTFKKVVFPFFNTTKHEFLVNKWWFRLLVAIYVGALVAIPIIIFLNYTDNSWCYGSLSYYEYNSNEYKETLNNCVQIGKDSILPGIGVGLIPVLVFHYIFQLFLFRLVINYIVLGGRNYIPKQVNKINSKTNPIKNNHLSGAIILGALILGGSLVLLQVNKQKSIEKQQNIEQVEKARQQELINNQKECEALAGGVMDQWSNVVGVTYDDNFWNECIVTYTDTETGEISTAPLSSMKTIK